jgi:hypothetical protein
MLHLQTYDKTSLAGWRKGEGGTPPQLRMADGALNAMAHKGAESSFLHCDFATLRLCVNPKLKLIKAN